MERLLVVSVSLAWVLLLINLLMTLRIQRWVQVTVDERRRYRGGRRELTVGAPAPDFRARTLDGRRVRLADWAGRAVAFIFSSPNCGTCRDDMPTLVRLAPLARKNHGVELVIVSDADADETQAWLDLMQREDGLEVPLPVLVAAADGQFLKDYNVKGSVPYFCLLDEHGRVQARSLTVEAEWQKLRRSWAGTSELASWMTHRH